MFIFSSSIVLLLFIFSISVVLLLYYCLSLVFLKYCYCTIVYLLCFRSISFVLLSQKQCYNKQLILLSGCSWNSSQLTFLDLLEENDFVDQLINSLSLYVLLKEPAGLRPSAAKLRTQSCFSTP